MITHIVFVEWSDKRLKTPQGVDFMVCGYTCYTDDIIIFGNAGHIIKK